MRTSQQRLLHSSANKFIKIDEYIPCKYRFCGVCRGFSNVISIVMIVMDMEDCLMSRRVCVFIVAVSMILSLCACNGSTNQDKDKIKIVTTIFPEYDWVREILGDKASDVNLIWLLDDGVDMHSYQPSVDDVIDISTCDLFIYVGGESDSWVEPALKEAENKDMRVINLLEVLGDDAREEETPDGADVKNNIFETEEDDEAEYDEHVWLSLKNAELFVEEIADVLSEIDSDNAEYYTGNAASFCGELSNLDERYASAVSEGKTKTLLFGDRFPFRYMVEDYGLKYYAAFEGCSSEVEASFETIAYLAGKLDEEALSAVLVTESSDAKIAEAIIENSAAGNQQILSLDSLQSVKKSDVEAGVTYVSLMESNLAVLEKALD
jgi:zinc transport system substrate-binding protein